MDERHFEVAGRLYKTTPEVAASQAQGQDALDVYLGQQPKPIEQLVAVAKVPLKHPLGQPHAPRADGRDAHALNLHYARFGIDPGKAHLGDPLPMSAQARLQQAIKSADGSEIPLGIPGIYRGYDDGYFYAANDGTQESKEAQQLRRTLATEKAKRLGNASPIAGNDNDPEIDEAVAQSYGKKKSATPSSKSAAAAGTPTPQTAAIENRLPQLISAIEKSQKNEALSAEESDLLARVDAAFAKAGVPIDLKKVDVDNLRRAAAASVDEGAATGAVGTAGAATARRPRTPLEAEVERVFGMSPDVPRPTLLPDPRGADGALTSDISQWTAPSILYDLARAFMAPGVAANGYPISDDEALNMAMTTMGGGAMSVRAVPHGGIGMPWAASGRVPRELARTADETVEFFYNPTQKELAEQLNQSAMKTLRAIRLKNGKVFTWPAEKSLHPDGIERLIADGIITEADLVGAERLLYEDGVGYHTAP